MQPTDKPAVMLIPTELVERLDQASQALAAQGSNAVRVRNELVARLARHQLHWTVVGIAGAVIVLFGIAMAAKGVWLGRGVGDVVGGLFITGLAGFITWSGYTRRNQ